MKKVTAGMLMVFLFLGFTTDLFAATAVQWNLTANATVTTKDANLSAAVLTVKSLKTSTVSSTSAPTAYSAAYGMSIAPDSLGKSWNSVFVDTQYVQFAVTVKKGYVLNVSSLSYDIGEYGGTSMSVAIYYSPNADFSNSQAIVPTSNPISSSIFLTKNTMYPQSNAVSITALTGTTLYFRVYSTCNTSSARWMLLRNFAIQGTVAVCPPLIYTSTSALSAFAQNETPSSTLSYTVTGILLADNVTVSPPAGFEISNDGSTWIGNPNSLTLTRSSDTLAGQPVTVFVRMNASVDGISSGVITHTSSGAATATVSVTGVKDALFYSNATGDLNDLSSWDVNPSGLGTSPPPSFAADGQTFVICNRTTATISSNWTVTGSGSKIVVGDSVNAIVFDIPTAYTVTAIVDVSKNATLTLRNRAYPTFGIIDPRSTINFAGSDTLTIPALNYGNISSIEDAGAVRVLASGTIGIYGIFSTGNALYNTAGSLVSFNGSIAQNIPTFTFNNLTIANSLVTTIAGNVKVNGICTIMQNTGVAASDTLTLVSGATVTSGKSLLVNGTVINNSTVTNGVMTVNSGGVFIQAVPATTGGTIIPSAAWNTGSLCKLTGIVGTSGADFNNLSGVNQTFYDFMIDCPNLIGKVVITYSGGSFTVTHMFTVNATGSGTVQIARSSTQNTVTVGNYTQNAGSVYIIQAGSTTGTRTFNVTNCFKLNGSSKFGIINGRTSVASTLMGILNVGGNFLMSPSSSLVRDTAQATLIFGGASGQTASFSKVSDSINIQINDAQNVVMTNSALLGDTLILTNGKLLIGANDLWIQTINGGSPSSYIVADSTGSLRRNVGAANVLFPVGTLASYTPATIKNSGIVDTFNVRVGTAFANPLTDTSKIVKRQWTVSEAAAGNGNAAVTLQWNAADEASAFSLLNSAVVDRDSNGLWMQTPTIVNGSNPYTVTVSGLTNFSNFVVGNPNAFVTSVKPSDGNRGNVPQVLWLGNNYPNPFNPTTTIEFTLAESGRISLKVYDMLGREITTLFSGDGRAGTVYRIPFDASRISSGLYFYRLETGNRSLVKKMTLLK